MQKSPSGNLLQQTCIFPEIQQRPFGANGRKISEKIA
jgi:hypothetical protein